MSTQTPEPPEALPEQETPENIALLSTVPVGRALTTLAVPMIAGMMAGSIYNVVNAVFVGQTHDADLLAALTFGLPIMVVVMAFGGLFGVGGSTHISRLLGEKRESEAAGVSALALWGSLCFGVIVMVLGLVLLHPLALALGARGAAVGPTMQYAGALLVSTPIMMAAFALEQLVRAEGFAKASMMGMLWSTLANVLFDAVLILGLGWGVLGAGLAVGLSNVVTLAYFLSFISRKSQNLGLSVRKVDLRWNETLKPVLSIGSSELVQSVFMLVTSLVMNFAAMSYGSELVAGIGVAQRVVQVSETVTMGIFMGGMPLLAYCVGALNRSRLRSALRASVVSILGFTVVFSGLIYLFRVQVLDLIGGGELVAGGEGILVAMLVSTIFNGITGLLIVWFQASGQARPSLVMTSLQGFLAIPFLLGMKALWGQSGVVWSITATEATMCLLGIVLFFVTGGVRGALDRQEEKAPEEREELVVDAAETAAAAPLTGAITVVQNPVQVPVSAKTLGLED